MFGREAETCSRNKSFNAFFGAEMNRIFGTELVYFGG